MPFGPRNLKELDCDLSQLKAIPGFPGYYINPNGDVFSIRMLNQYSDEDGYARVSTGNLRKAIHWLLARVFLPPPEIGQNEVRHLDGNPRNNNIGNLAWGTRAQNAADMARHGTVKGSRNAKAILSESQVVEIVSLLNQKTKHHEIAKKFNVSMGTVKAISCGQNWSHLTGRGLEVGKRELAEL